MDLPHLLLSVPPVLISISVHEAAHAYTAMRFGDPTAAMLGRVTLNPIKHLDPLGTFMLFFSGFIGWAKPVPVNTRQLRNPTKHRMLVSLAGPAANVMFACIGIVVFRGIIFLVDSYGIMPGNVFLHLMDMLLLLVFYNVTLAVFNMLPVHPLDGSKVLEYFLPYNAALAYSGMERYGMLIILAVALGVRTGYLPILEPFQKITAYFVFGGGYL